MPIPADRWTEIKVVFDAVAELPPPQREALIQAVALSAEQVQELRSLLDGHDSAQSFLGGSAAESLADNSAATRVGQRLGAWEIVRAVGAGGMGEVYEARRADGSFEGRAAIKLLKRGMDSVAVLRRFAQERQALARLSHPHIARLLDAGASADGQPYFVLEFVDGEPIHQAVQGLDFDARLRLFLQLTDAVAHAHRQLLVHRDLKPGNVLVDREGQVKLLDFGIAKALDPLEGTDGDTTIAGQRPYTPQHASPEQVRGEPVGTATDIYSLGVLLYQLLTGTRPTGRQASTPQEAARSVLEELPTRPSRLLAAETPDPDWLRTRKKLAGDLDNILLKTLEKAPERRYASVDALADDLRRYLDGFPVSARPASWRYRAVKQVARNRLASAAIALGVLALLGGSVATAWQAQQARQAQALAEARLKEVRRVTHELVFGFGDGVEYLPGGMKIKVELLREALASLQRLLPALGGDAALQADIAQLHVRLAESYAPGYPASLGEAGPARQHAEAAVALVEQIWPTQQHNAALAVYVSRAYTVLAGAEREAGRLAAAAALSGRGLALARQALAAAPAGAPTLRLRGAVTAAALDLATMLDDNGVGLDRPAEAMLLYEVARESALQEQTLKAEAAQLDAATRPGHASYAAELGQTLAIINGSIASSRLRRGDYEGAAAARAEAVAQLRVSRQTHPDLLQFQESLATSLSQQVVLELFAGRPQAALRAAEESAQLIDGLLAADLGNAEWRTARELRALAHGTVLAQLGRHADALPLLRRGLAYWQTAMGKSNTPRHQRMVAVAEFRLQRSLALQGGPAAAPAWAAAAAAAERLQALTQAKPATADAWLMRAEAEHVLGSEGPAAQRAALQASACNSWREAALLRPLPPAVLPLQSACPRANLG